MRFATSSREQVTKRSPHKLISEPRNPARRRGAAFCERVRVRLCLLAGHKPPRRQAEERDHHGKRK